MRWLRNASKALSVVAVLGLMWLLSVQHVRVHCEWADVTPFGGSVFCISLNGR